MSTSEPTPGTPTTPAGPLPAQPAPGTEPAQPEKPGPDTEEHDVDPTAEPEREDE